MANSVRVGAAPEYPEELLAQQRGALVATWLQGGRVMTTIEIAAALGTTYRGAVYLMNKLSAVIPICRDDDGAWLWVGEE